MRMAPDTADLSVRLSAKSNGTKRSPTGVVQRGEAGPVVSISVGLTQIVPHVHLSAQRADLDDGLAQEVVGLALELLFHARLDVVVLVPHSHLDAVRGVVALAAETETRQSATATYYTAQYY